MVKQTQTIHRQFDDEWFECVDHFVGLTLKELNMMAIKSNDFVKYLSKLADIESHCDERENCLTYTTSRYFNYKT